MPLGSLLTTLVCRTTEMTENPPVAALPPVKRGKSLGSGRYSKHSFHLLITFPPLMTPISSSYRKAWA